LLTGNDLISDMHNNGTAANQFIIDWVSVDFVRGDVHPLIDDQTSPHVLSIPGNGIINSLDEWALCNYPECCCPLLAFDAVIAQEPAVRLAAFTDRQGNSDAYAYSAATLFEPNNNAKVVHCPYDLMYMLYPNNQAKDIIAARTKLLYDILSYFGHAPEVVDVSGMPCMEESTAQTAAENTVSVFTLPDGSGDPLNDCKTYSDIMPLPADATITVTLNDVAGNPIYGYPAEDIWIETEFGGLILCCAAGSIADRDTDIDGITKISGTVCGGGWSDAEIGERTVVKINQEELPLTGSGFILFNSADVNGDCVINLVDVITFTHNFFEGHHYSCDFFPDQSINLSDVVLLARSFGVSCDKAGGDGVGRNDGEISSITEIHLPGEREINAAILATQVHTSDSIGIYADPAGQRAITSAKPNEPFELYLVLKNPQQSNVAAWQCRVAATDNIRLLDWTLMGQALNVASQPDFLVGLGQPLNADAAVVLATVRCVVLDKEPAFLDIRPLDIAPEHTPVPGYLGRGDNTSDDIIELSKSSGEAGAVVFGVNTLAGQSLLGLPQQYSLSPNVPNPFNPQTTIFFDLPAPQPVNLSIYAVSGYRVACLVSEQMSAGTHSVVWRGADDSGRKVASGTYFYRLQAGEYTETRRMILIK